MPVIRNRVRLTGLLCLLCLVALTGCTQNVVDDDVFEPGRGTYSASPSQSYTQLPPPSQELSTGKLVPKDPTPPKRGFFAGLGDFLFGWAQDKPANQPYQAIRETPNSYQAERDGWSDLWTDK